MHYLGIDWATEKHDLCLLADDGRVLSEFTITSDLKGFQRLQQALQASPEVRINIERVDGLLVEWLVAQGYDVYVSSPSFIAKRRATRSKSDRGDAYLLAHVLQNQEPDCRPLPRQSPIAKHLKQLASAYDLTVREQRRLANRLIFTLQLYFPAILQAFRVPHSLICLAFLEAYATPQAAQALSLAELETFLRSHRYTHIADLPKIYAALHMANPCAEVDAGYVTTLRLLIPLLRTLHQERYRLTKELHAVFETHPQAAWWHRFPGTDGPLTAARLLAWLGDNPKRFPTPGSLQAIAGTVPFTRESGKKRVVEFRFACSHPLRRAIDHFARQSVKHCGWASSYFHDQLARGHSRSRAYRALANRWLRIIWTLWQTGEVYDEAKHIANRSKKGSFVKSSAAQ
jgi:transposase